MYRGTLLLFYGIIDLSYDNKLLNNEVNELIISFKDKYNIETKSIIIDDKGFLYKFMEEYNNINLLYKRIINKITTVLE